MIYHLLKKPTLEKQHVGVFNENSLHMYNSQSVSITQSQKPSQSISQAGEQRDLSKLYFNRAQYSIRVQLLHLIQVESLQITTYKLRGQIIFSLSEMLIFSVYMNTMLFTKHS